jgi:ureidoacrylate peracid hydrolase
MQIPKSKCALLIVDMQNGFVHPRSAMGLSPSGTAAQQAIVPTLVRFVDFCRGNAIPILWSQQEHFSEDQTRLRKTIRPHSARQGFLPCLRGTWETELFEGIRPAFKDTDHVITKHRASVFYNTNVESKLRMLGTQFLLVAGCNTEFCVESTVRDAYARDFEIIVLRDAVAGINSQFHANSLALFQAYFGEVLACDEVRSILL